MCPSTHLNQVVEGKTYRRVLHVDSEESCLAAVAGRGYPVLPLETWETPTLPVVAEVGLIRPSTGSLAEFCAFLNRLAPGLEAQGISPQDVLVVTDCWGKTGPDCRGPASVYDEDWSGLQASPFDISLWDGHRCAVAHDVTGACVRP